VSALPLAHDPAAAVAPGDALPRLFDAQHGRLVAVARRYVRCPAAAADVVADVFARLWERRATWRPSGAAEVYVVAAVRNRALNVARDARGRGAHLARLGADAGARRRPARRGGGAVRRAQRRARAPRTGRGGAPRHRHPPAGAPDVLLLRARGFGWTEIAGRLGTSVAAAQMQHGRAVRALGALVGEAHR
jgi:DNA-directed RNA polymerase specialized sigma24 family protein